MIVGRILLIPVIAAVGYEILRFGARHRANPLVRAIMPPGSGVQKITTRQPTDDMIEVAIVSMEQALVADGETSRTAARRSSASHSPARPAAGAARPRSAAGPRADATMPPPPCGHAAVD